MQPAEVVENVIKVTNQSKGSVLAVLSELDVQILAGLKAGRIVKLPNGTRYEPVGKKDGSINIVVHVDKELENQVNAFFEGDWINGDHIGWTETKMIEHWNKENPETPILVK